MADRPSDPKPTPLVFGFTDYRDYLNKWMVERHAQVPGYTIARFARMAGCSPSHVRNVLTGDRDLNPPYVDGFIRALRLAREDAEFFTLLVRYSQAETILERACLLQQIAGTLRFQQAHPLDGVQLLHLTRLSHVAVYELSLLPEFREDPAWISDVLSITEPEARAAVAELRSVALLVEGPDGVARAAFPFNATPAEIASPAVALFHDRAMELAAANADGPAEDRRYFAAVGGVPGSLVPDLRAAVDRFHRRIDHLMAELQAPTQTDGATSPPPDTVYLVQVQLVPVARSTRAPPGT